MPTYIVTRKQSEGAHMNTFERRRLIKGQVIDVTVAKTALHESRRQRAEAAKKLRKALAAKQAAAAQAETISYPRQAAG
jgi:hypothetical protein